jgi:hydrogenase expression/formation protein HypC
MCLGIPMQVESVELGFAWASGHGQRRRVDTALVGECLPGDWLLVFIDSARERIDAVRAAEISGVLALLEAALSGTPAQGPDPIDLPSHMDVLELARLVEQGIRR